MNLCCWFLGHDWRPVKRYWVAYNKVKRYHYVCRRCPVTCVELVDRNGRRYPQDEAWP